MLNIADLDDNNVYEDQKSENVCRVLQFLLAPYTISALYIYLYPRAQSVLVIPIIASTDSNKNYLAAEFPSRSDIPFDISFWQGSCSDTLRNP